jgi:hypothetical protein
MFRLLLLQCLDPALLLHPEYVVAEPLPVHPLLQPLLLLGPLLVRRRGMHTRLRHLLDQGFLLLLLQSLLLVFLVQEV